MNGEINYLTAIKCENKSKIENVSFNNQER